MKLTADDNCRLTSRELFKPKAEYEAQKTGAGRIVLTEIVTPEVPTVKPQLVNGRLRGANLALSRETVAAAVREAAP